MPVKSDVKERLKADGVWKPFCVRREKLKSEGRTPSEAQRVALQEFCSDDSPAVAPEQAGTEGAD